MKSFKYASYIVFAFIFIALVLYTYNSLHKNSSPYTFNASSQTVIKEMKSLNRMETASFTIEKVIDAGTSGNAFQEFLYGDKILLIAHGQVIAGIDMSKLSENDAKISGTSVTLTLPQPEILITSLDSNQTRVYDRKQGVLTHGSKDLESQARVVAQDAIRAAACKGEILAQASENARKQLTSFLKALGFTTVTIIIPEGTCS